ncbi:MAG TPA: VCBS repeat-containing protein [Asanoa sp.]
MFDVAAKVRGGARVGSAAVVLLAAAGLFAPTPVRAADAPVPCVTGGRSADDLATADALAPRLTGRLAGELDAYRVSCARRIVARASARGLPDPAAVVAVTAAIVESGLRNLGTPVDHDSLGLFQQRGSWGAAGERLDPGWATDAFLATMRRRFPGGSWRVVPVGAVAQGVQVSAYPSRYAPEAADAVQVVAALAGSADVATPPEPDPATTGPRVPGDVDGDGKTDRTLWDPSTGAWSSWATSSGRRATTGELGHPGDVPVPGDLDGDGRADRAVWRPSTGEWLVPSGSAGVLGRTGDVPVAADYDGDGRADRAVWRPSTGEWFGLGDAGAGAWGRIGDVPVAGDFDGDGRADRALWRPSTGEWFVRSSAHGAPVLASGLRFGAAGDLPVTGDFDGDRRTDAALWTRSTATWTIRSSATGERTTAVVGAPGDTPVAGDFDGDGRADPATWQPTTGRWAILFSSTGALATTGVWGKAPQRPV